MGRTKKQTSIIIFCLFLASLTRPAFCLASEGTVSLVSLKKARMHRLKGDHDLRNGDLSAAIHEYKKSLELNPFATITTFNLATAYYLKKDIKEAASALEKLVKLNPKDVEALYNLGCFELYGRNFEEAKTYFEKVRLYSGKESRFLPLAQKGLAFIERLENLDSKTQEAAILYILQGIA